MSRLGMPAFGGEGMSEQSDRSIRRLGGRLNSLRTSPSHHGWSGAPNNRAMKATRLRTKNPNDLPADVGVPAPGFVADPLFRLDPGWEENVVLLVDVQVRVLFQLTERPSHWRHAEQVPSGGARSSVNSCTRVRRRHRRDRGPCRR